MEPAANMVNKTRHVRAIKSERGALVYDYLFKLILVGPTNVGKSCFLFQYIKQRFLINYVPTNGAEISIVRRDQNCEPGGSLLFLRYYCFRSRFSIERGRLGPCLPHYLR